MPLILGLSNTTRMTRLQISRLHLGWSRESLARQSAISVRTIENHELGVRNVYTDRTVIGLTQVLGVESTYLVRGMRDIWEGDGKLWRKHPRLFDGWEEIVIPSRHATLLSEWTTATTSIPIITFR